MIFVSGVPADDSKVRISLVNLDTIHANTVYALSSGKVQIRLDTDVLVHCTYPMMLRHNMYCIQSYNEFYSRRAA